MGASAMISQCRLINVFDRPTRDRSGVVTRIALLGVLARGPAHGYEVKAALKRWHMHFWADVQAGSVYAGLKKLDASGFARVAETGRNGRRPAYRVYEITDAGREHFHALLRAAWVDTTRYSRPVDLAVSFYDDVPRREIVPLLTERVARLKAIEATFAAEPDLPDSGPAQRAVVTDLRDHELRLVRAEIEWSNDLIKRMRAKVYPPSYKRKR